MTRSPKQSRRSGGRSRQSPRPKAKATHGPPYDIKRIEVEVYGLCVLREREPSPGAHFLDIFLVGRPGAGCGAAHDHDPLLIYDGAYENGSGLVRRSLLCNKLDLTWLPAKTKSTWLPDDIVSLYDVTKQPLPPLPDQVPSVAGYVTLLGGGRSRRHNPGRKGWGLMAPPNWAVTKRWTRIAWYATWAIDLKTPLPRLDLKIESLTGGPAPVPTPSLHATDPSGVIVLKVSNLPHPLDPPMQPGPEVDENSYVPHFAMYEDLYPGWGSPWPYLVYGPKEKIKPEPMKDPMTHDLVQREMTTAYTCVPSQGK